MKLGCLTSPHLIDVRERIRLDSAPISKELFTHHFLDLYSRVHENEHRGPPIPGYPGFLALLGIYIFIKEGVEMAIFETGIGGENDSTNIVDHPTVTGITTLGLDHMKVLGGNIGSIAWHKAGIFKTGAPAFTVEQDTAALEVLQQRSCEKRIAGDLNIVSEHLVEQYGVTVTPNLPYQKSNASLAIALCEACLRAVDPNFGMTTDIAFSLEQTKLPGRNEVYREGQRTWLLSTAHNEMSIKESSSWFKEILEQPE